MSSDPRITQLLLHYEELREQGRTISLKDLCRDCPELLEPVKQEIRALQRVKQLGDATQVGTNPPLRPAAAAPAGLEHLDFLAPPQKPDEIGRLGSYGIRRVLGSGGMGIVFEAKDLKLQRSVALKVMRPHLTASKSAKQRFLREARAAAALEHDHIVPIFQVGEEQDISFLVMPLLKGQTLEQRLEGENQLGLAETLRIGREIADGLAAAHEHGLIHRDIKPGNIWLEASPGRESGGGRVKILDFGLARAVDSEDIGTRTGRVDGTGDQALTHTGDVLGTPQFMAPEQARGDKVDFRCDLFSLGCVLYRLCTGRKPFPGKNSMAILTALATKNPTPPRELNPSVPAKLSVLVQKLLAKKPENRPGSARVVIAALLAIEAELVEPTSPGTKPARDRAVSPTTTLPKNRPTLPKVDLRSRLMQPMVLSLATLCLVLIGLGVWIIPKWTSGPGLAPPQPKPEPVGEVRKFEGHTDTVRCAVFSPKGDLIATAGWDKSVRLWDVKTGMQVQIFNGHTDRVWIVVFSPDGNYVLSGGNDKTLRLWDLKTGKQVKQYDGIQGEVSGAAFMPDGKHFFSSSEIEKPLRFWDRESCLDTLRFAHQPLPSRTVRVSPDGRVALTGNTDKALRLWDIAGGKELGKMEGQEGIIVETAWAQDGRHAYSSGYDNTVRKWDVLQRRLIGTFKGHKELVEGVAVTPDGHYVVSGAHDNTVRVWDAMSARELHRFEGHTKPVTCVAVSPDGRYALSSSWDHTIRLWRLPDAPPGPQRWAWPADRLREGKILAPDLSKVVPIVRGDAKEGKWPDFPIGKRGDAPGFEVGVAQGKYFLLSPAWRWVWNLPGATGETFACEMVARVSHAGVSWGMTIGQGAMVHGIVVQLHGDGSLSLMPSPFESQEFRGPFIGPIRHPAIKKFPEVNTLLVVVHERTVEVYVNGVAVYDPVLLDRMISPGAWAMGIWNPQWNPKSGDRVEYDRIRLWTPFTLPSLADRGAVPVKTVPVEVPAPRQVTGLPVLADVDFRKPETARDIPLLPDTAQTKLAIVKDECHFRANQPGEWYTPGYGREAQKLKLLDNFICEVDGYMKERGRASWGLAWGTGDRNYQFEAQVREFDHGAHVRLVRTQGAQHDEILPWTMVPFLWSALQYNTLRLEVEGTKVRLFINGRHVGDRVDDRIKPGSIHLLVYAEEAPAEARFRSFRLWQLPVPKKTPPPKPRETKNQDLVKEFDFKSGKVPWAIGETGNAISRPKDGQYQLLAKVPGVWITGGMTSPLNNFICEVEARLVASTDGGWGMGFQGDIPKQPWIGVQVWNDKKVRFYEYDVGPLTPWLEATAMRSITETNILRVEVVDKTVRLFVNGQHVGDGHRAQLLAGTLHLCVYANQANVDARIQRVRIWRVSSEEKSSK